MRKALQLSDPSSQSSFCIVINRQIVESHRNAVQLNWLANKMLGAWIAGERRHLDDSLLCDLHRELFVWVESAFSTTGYLSNCTHELILCKEAMAIAGCF